MKHIEVVSRTLRQSLAVRRYECDFMSVILWIFKISAAGYNFLRRSRRDIWGEFHVLFGQYTGKRSFYY